MNKSIILLLLILGLCSGCYQTEIDDAEPQLVVEGWIENDRPPIIQLTTTVPISKTKRSLDSLDQHVLNWAKVSVSDGEKEVIMTGIYNRKLFPPYVYTTTELKGEVGKTYKLKVDYAQFHAEAETTIPVPTQITNIHVIPVKDRKMTYVVKATILDDANTEDYYKVFVRSSEKDMTMRSSYFGLFNDKTLSKDAVITIYNGRNNLALPYIKQHFLLDEKILIKFCHLDSIGYQYWKAFEDYHVEGRNPLFNTMQKLPTNIKGGLGYWLGYGSTYYPLLITEK